MATNIRVTVVGRIVADMTVYTPNSLNLNPGFDQLIEKIEKRWESAEVSITPVN